MKHNQHMNKEWRHLIISVAIYLPKSLSYPTAYIGILKAGGGYLPLETSYPEALLKNVLEDALPKAIITSEKLADERIKKAVEASGVQTELFIIDDQGFWKDDLLNESPREGGIRMFCIKTVQIKNRYENEKYIQNSHEFRLSQNILRTFSRPEIPPKMEEV